MQDRTAQRFEPTSRTQTDAVVRERYSAAADRREEALCCPVDYDARLLEAIPAEVIERDYGCGDPSPWVREGETVLDLGSGGGKICFIASQLVGPSGRVIGVDINAEMLELARRSAPEVARRIGHGGVEFRRGHIQDLRLDVDALEAWIEKHPVHTIEGLAQLDAERDRLREQAPMIEDASVDIVVSNCVLNLVHEADKMDLIREIHRVLRPGGRIAISDIVSDEDVPAELRADAELHSGCVSGAFHERELLGAFERAGFGGLRIERFEHAPFAEVQGIEFRSVTITGFKLDPGPCLEAGHAILYAGPWRQVEDDDGHVLRRGVRTAVCAKTFAQLKSGPYADQVIALEPYAAIPAEEQQPFDCERTAPRHPRETKRGLPAPKRESPGCC